MNIKVIEFKEQCFTLLVLNINNENIDLIKIGLEKKIKKFPYCFNSIYVVVNVSVPYNFINWIEIKNLLKNYSIQILGFTGNFDNILKKEIINSGTPFLLNKKKNINNKIYSQIKFSINNVNNTNKYNDSINNDSLIIKKPIRSGQKIYAPNSDVIILSNVSAGAEIIAHGNIHIYGELRGRALAGSSGNQNCHIFCTKMFAELVSISGKYCLIDQIPLMLIGKGAQIFLKNGELKILEIN
ncbi:septum site-determining protein MinC [Buchnera aphidicola (Thelaxes californica)]|uniref:Probable septum site-determining protein MinC n=1 Tax=Buchnera aphidicola (Thelaxes californica) TaxID=1315998 RepID=A0A4D6Y9U2_9GAMM|nr:septum site-determining protein MinC [Buchnera aphidicola]QCI26786.1 septum site-determining protein MinC [Buchnera aphidicola (Thelaxes californica)]